MRLLLDTHIFLWYITADSRLAPAFGAAIRDPASEINLSTASIWEAVIKHGLGKLPLPGPPAEYLPAQRNAHGITLLPIDEGSIQHLAGLSPIHRDPFDRIIVAQAIQHGLTIVTVDGIITGYPVPLLATTDPDLAADARE